MIAGARVLAVVPARSRSRGIPDKNIQLLDGVPLLGIAIQHARMSTRVDQVVLSTDSAKYAETGREHGADVPFLRPPELSTDDANPVHAIFHLIDRLDPRFGDNDVVALIEPTSPLREPGIIDRAIEHLAGSAGLSSVVSVSILNATHPDYLYVTDETGVRLTKMFEPAIGRSGYVRRQDLGAVYYLDGNVYVARVGALRLADSFVTDSTGFVVSAEMTALEIDTLVDLACAEAILKFRNEGRQS